MVDELMTTLDTAKFLEDLTGKHARLYTAAIEDMLIAMALGNKPALSDARRRLGEIITETMGTAEVLGATITLRAAAGAVEEDQRESFSAGGGIWLHPNDALHLLRFAATPTQTIIPRVTFLEELEDMVTRTPVTIRKAAERTAQAIAKLYGEGRVVAFVRSAEQAVTERVQDLIVEAIREGIPELDFMRDGRVQPGAGTNIRKAVDAIRTKTGAWTEGYSRMVFRTNVNTAVTAGRFRVGMDPDITAIMPAVEFFTSGDSDVRPSHAAGDGKIMLRTNRAWEQLAPPIDYNCRCGVRDVGLPELRRMNRVRVEPTTGFTRVKDGLYVREDRPPAAWKPNPKFRQSGRPDLFLNGVVG